MKKATLDPNPNPNPNPNPSPNPNPNPLPEPEPEPEPDPEPWPYHPHQVKRATLDPEWDETLELSVYDKDILDADEAEERRCQALLSLELWDHDTVG